MCGIAPQGITVIQKVGSYDPVQIYSLGQACPTASNATAAGVSAPTTSPNTSASGSSGGGGTNLAGAIAGAVVGAVALVAIVAAAVFLGSRRRRRRQQLANKARFAQWYQDPRKANSLDDKVGCFLRLLLLQLARFLHRCARGCLNSAQDPGTAQSAFVP
jgi:hypothetical protein